MKTMSFYSAKGGVGKSTHTVMFASYLAYVEGAKVAVIDTDLPLMRLVDFRKNELRALSNKNSNVSRYLETHGGLTKPYELRGLINESDSMDSDLDAIMHERLWNFVDSKEGRSYDYILVDFDASYLLNTVVYRSMRSGLLDFIAVPVDTDRMCRQAAYDACCTFFENDQPFKLFWNNVSSADIAREGYLNLGEEPYKKKGFEFYPERIKSFQRAKRDSDWMLFVRSSLCFPVRHAELACPELIPFYQHVKRDLDSM